MYVQQHSFGVSKQFKWVFVYINCQTNHCFKKATWKLGYQHSKFFCLADAALLWNCDNQVQVGIGFKKKIGMGENHNLHTPPAHASRDIKVKKNIYICMKPVRMSAISVMSH